MRAATASLLTIALFAFGGCTKNGAGAKPNAVAGTISISNELAAKLAPTDVLYIIARGPQFGPPAAVKRIVNPKFPISYALGPEDAMIPGVAGFEPGASLSISARVARSGKTLPVSGDFEGAYLKNPAHPGEAAADFTIDRQRP